MRRGPRCWAQSANGKSPSASPCRHQHREDDGPEVNPSPAGPSAAPLGLPVPVRWGSLQANPRDGGQSPETPSVWARGWAHARLSCPPSSAASPGRRRRANGEHDSARKRSAAPILSWAPAAANHPGEQSHGPRADRGARGRGDGTGGSGVCGGRGNVLKFGSGAGRRHSSAGSRRLACTRPALPQESCSRVKPDPDTFRASL